MRTILVNTPNYCLDFEWWDGYPVLHFETYIWSKDTFKQWLIEFELVKDKFRKQNIDYMFVWARPDNKKLIKFAEMFGFEINFKSNSVYLLGQEI